MPPPEEFNWVKSTANELNNLLQVITESSQFLQRFTGGNPEAARYYDMMRSAVDRAAQLSKTMLERSGQAGDRPKLHPFPGPGSFGSAPRRTGSRLIRQARRRVWMSELRIPTGLAN